MDLTRATGGRAWLYAGSVALVVGGRIVAVAWGTTYAIRVPAGAHAPGHEPAHRWGSGRVTDLTTELGPGWRFGRWDDREATWLAAFAVQ